MKGITPELSSTFNCESETIPTVFTIRKDCQQFSMHVVKYEAEFSEGTPIRACLIVHIVSGILEEPDGLFTLILDVLHGQFEVLIIIKKPKVVITVSFKYHTNVLVDLWYDIQDAGRTAF